VAEAERTADFLCRRLRREDGRWLRSWQAAADGGAGAARHLSYGADHGALVDAFVSLHEATGRLRWLDEALDVALAILELFWDPRGVFTTGSDAEQLITRPRDLLDDATPSATSSAAVGFLRLAAHTGDGSWAERARELLAALGGVAGRSPLAVSNLLWAVDLDARGATEVVVTGDRPDLVAAVHRRFRPTTVLAWGERGSGPLWEGRDEVGTAGRAYVCRDHACRAPVTDVAALEAELAPRR
jgi:uncharacterized protein YyaL (SSP411 family)